MLGSHLYIYLVYPFPQRWPWVFESISRSIRFHKNGLGYPMPYPGPSFSWSVISTKTALGIQLFWVRATLHSIASITWVFLNYHPFLENYVWWVPISFIRFHKNDLECSISWSIRLHKNDPGYSINWLLVHPFPQNLSWVFHFLTSGLSVSTKTVLGIPSTDSLSIHFNENGLGYLAISWLLVHPFPQKRSWIFGHV